MKKICFIALAALALSACNSEPKFKVEGEVSGADGQKCSIWKPPLWKVSCRWTLSN